MYYLRLHYYKVCWLGSWLMYVLYMYFWEEWPSCVTVKLYHLNETWLRHYLLTFFVHLNIPFGSAILSSCMPFLVWRENDVDQYNLSNNILYLKRNNCIVKSFYRLFIIVRGMTIPWSPIITFFKVPIFGRLFSWQYFISSQFSTGFSRCWAFMLLYVFNNLHVGLMFHPYLASNLLDARPTNITLVNV